MEDTARQNEAIRLLQWIMENPDEWYRIYTSSEDYMEPKECVEYIQLMEQNGFYSMIAIILSNNRGQRYIGKAIDKFVLKALIQKCENDGIKQFTKDLKAAMYAEGTQREQPWEK